MYNQMDFMRNKFRFKIEAIMSKIVWSEAAKTMDYVNPVNLPVICKG